MQKALHDPRLVGLCAEAIAVQNACNLSGVVHSYSRVMSMLWEIAHEEKEGTDWVNQHAVSFLFAYKCLALAGHEALDSARFDTAYWYCAAVVDQAAAEKEVAS